MNFDKFIVGRCTLQKNLSCRLAFASLLVPVLLLATRVPSRAVQPPAAAMHSSATITINTTQITDGRRGTAYLQELSASGGQSPYTWSVAGGTRLPMGLKLDAATGIISGYPVREGTTTVAIRVADSRGNSASRAYSIDVMLVPGELWSWSPDRAASPTDEMDGIVAAAEGDDHHVALRYDGSVWTWGDNHANQLGSGASSTSKRPIPGIAAAIAIAAGKDHTAVLTADGTVTEFGNYWGSPRTFTNTGFVTLSGGDYYTVALKEDGTVWTWLYDQAPHQVTGLPRIAAIAAGRSYLGGGMDVALAEDGTVWTWTHKNPLPAPPSSFSDAIAIADGSHWLKADGTVPGTTITGAIAISTSAALKADGTVWNTVPGSPTQPINGLNGVTAITRTTALVPYLAPDHSQDRRVAPAQQTAKISALDQ